MNERVEELAKQVDACYIPRYDMWQMDTASLKKFADLLIKETTNIIIIGHKGHMNPALATDSVKQHFGVKE